MRKLFIIAVFLPLSALAQQQPPFPVINDQPSLSDKILGIYAGSQNAGPPVAQPFPFYGTGNSAAPSALDNLLNSKAAAIQQNTQQQKYLFENSVPQYVPAPAYRPDLSPQQNETQQLLNMITNSQIHSGYNGR
jgi:hypothetical protein